MEKEAQEGNHPRKPFLRSAAKRQAETLAKSKHDPPKRRRGRCIVLTDSDEDLPKHASGESNQTLDAELPGHKMRSKKLATANDSDKEGHRQWRKGKGNIFRYPLLFPCTRAGSNVFFSSIWDVFLDNLSIDFTFSSVDFMWVKLPFINRPRLTNFAFSFQFRSTFCIAVFFNSFIVLVQF